MNFTIRSFTAINEEPRSLNLSEDGAARSAFRAAGPTIIHFLAPPSGGLANRDGAR